MTDAAPIVALADVEWRVDGKPTQGDGPTRARFVPYVDVTTVTGLLDKWVGPENWRDEYALGELAGKPVLWCYLSVRVNGDEWITKRDVGVASNFEAQKGMVSDALKRVACIKWGIARNVYDLPNLWAPCRVDQKGNAWPVPQTLTVIHEELAKLGYDKAGRLSAEGSEEVSRTETGPTEGSPSLPADGSQPDAPSDPVAGSVPKGTGETEPSRTGPQESPRDDSSPPPHSGQGVEAADTSSPGTGEPTPSSDPLGFLSSLPSKDVLKVAKPYITAKAIEGHSERVPTKPEHLADLCDECLEGLAEKCHAMQGALV